MKKRILSILLCVCMVLTLMPMSALAAAYSSWAEATADGVTLTEGDTVTIGGTDYIYKINADVSTSGLNISGKNNDGTGNSAYDAPTAKTLYKAGNGYAIFTPAESGTNAKLELHNAVINTANGRALYLPAEPVDITVTGDNSLTANGSYNYAIDTNGQAASITGDGNLSLTGSKCIASWSGGTPGITIDIGGDLVASTTYSYSFAASGNIDLSAASINTGIVTAGSGSFTATAKTGNLTIDNGLSSSVAVMAYNGITLEATKGKISVTGKGNILMESSGKITLNAQDDIEISNSGTSSDTIRFGTGVSITSNAGSINVTTSGYSCMEKISDGTVSSTVSLNTAKDITLNAEYTAISASSQDVTITAGGKLSSTSFYGFQTGALTIKASEVTIAGTVQDGIYASSVSITNTDGTSNCKSVSIAATSIYNDRAAIQATGNATVGNITVKADDLFLCGKGSAKAIKANGTVTIVGAGLIAGTITAGTDNIDAGVTRASKSGGDVSTSGLDLSTPPADTTVYTAGNGYALFTPASGETPATLTLHNAEISTAGEATLKLDAETVIKLEGTNSLVNNDADSGVGIAAYSSTGDGLQPITIQGFSGASLAVSAWQCTYVSALTISGGSVSMNGSVYGMVAEGNVILQNGAQVSVSGTDAGYALLLEQGASATPPVDLTIDGGSTLTVNDDAYITGSLTVSGSGSKLTLNSGAWLGVDGAITVGSSAALENNGTVGMKLGTTVEQIKALNMTGTGVVEVVTANDEDGYPEAWDYYTNDGVAVKAITGGLDLTADGHSGKTVANDGYTWDSASSTLTLGNAYVSGGITLPDQTTVNTTSDSSINGTISGPGGTSMHITFTGAAPLTINGGISLGANGDTLTVEDGAHVTVNGGFSLGAYGLDGILNVNGSGTTLNISSSNSYAVMCGAVNVQNGAFLTAKAEGTDSVGIKVLKSGGSVSVTGGSTLTTGCDYGVLIIDGKLTVGDTSKLITNGTIAPFCIIDTTSSKEQSDVLSLAGTPSDTEIASVKGTTDFSGNKHTYWSLIPKNGTLGVTNEEPEFASLTGAKTGTLTFVKAASSGGSGSGSGGGSGIAGYSLSFETNGGSKISGVSKENGTTIDLVNLKPTWDGYAFDGWYSDKALTEKVTSIKLTTNTTIYAKWTEKTAKGINPFTDVSENAYYHDGVLWAAQESVTSGTTNTAFSPDLICTRAQIITFLWRTMGSPEPTSADCPFVDVSQNAYYYKAVLWAVEKDITAGTSPTIFSPNAIVNRGQIVTLLWRAAGKPSTTSTNPFADVSKDAYYYNAMLWTVEEGVTQGTSATKFSSSAPCTRAQSVTFLYRYAGK